MVGANCKNAEYIDPKVVPFMYRVHEGPSVQKLKKAEAIIIKPVTLYPFLL